MLDDENRTQKSADQKNFWFGILENPAFSRFQRHLLDRGRDELLSQIIGRYAYSNVLDVGCGSGLYSCLKRNVFLGLDNSMAHIHYAAQHFPGNYFVCADAFHLPVKPNVFDLVLLVDIGHHLTDSQIGVLLEEAVQISNGYIVLSDPVLFEGQSLVSRFFYGMDRGRCFRHQSDWQRLLDRCRSLELVEESYFTTFPNIYRRMVRVLKKTQDELMS